MIRILVSVHDRVANEFQAPFCVAVVGVAARMLFDELRRSDDNVLKLHPDDYALYKIGCLDTETGVVTGQKPELVVEIAALVDHGEC